MPLKVSGRQLLFSLFAGGFAQCKMPLPASRPPQGLAGMYKLHIMEDRDPQTGNWAQSPWCAGGENYIIYDGMGHMAVQFTPKGYGSFDWLNEAENATESVVDRRLDSMSVAELKAAVKLFSSNYVYFANYSDSAGILTHNRLVSTIPKNWGTSVKRQYWFAGDTLFLQSVNGSRRLKWLRQE